MKSKNVITPLTILLVTETWPPEINGVANSIYQLTLGLKALNNRIILVRPKANTSIEKITDDEVFVKAYNIPNYESLQFGSPQVLKLTNTIKKHKPDVVHIVTEGPLGVAALMAARLCKVPVSSGYHSQFDDFSAFLSVKAMVKPITGFLNWFHNRCDLTCVPSQKSYDQLSQHNIKNLHIVGRGVDTDKFNPKHRSQSLRESWHADEETTVVMYVGRVSPEKNIDLTIKSFRALKKAQPKRKLKLVIVGDGPAYKTLKQTTADAIFVGAKTGEALSEHYASGDVFVFASEVETFGNVVTEAMSSGQAVVAYHDAAAAKYVTNDCGWTILKSDENAFTKQVEQLPDLAKLKTMGLAGNSKMQAMGWDTAVKQFYQAFAKAIVSKDTTKVNDFIEVLNDNWVSQPSELKDKMIN